MGKQKKIISPRKRKQKRVKKRKYLARREKRGHSCLLKVELTQQQRRRMRKLFSSARNSHKNGGFVRGNITLFFFYFQTFTKFNFLYLLELVLLFVPTTKKTKMRSYSFFHTQIKYLN